jgi:hypothetical protein
VKLNNTGVIQWQNCLGGTLIEESNAVQQTTDGGYILAGFTSSNDGTSSGCSGQNYWVAKINNTGSLQWQKCLGGIGSAKSIQQTSDGGFIVAGYTTSSGGNVTGFQGGSDYWIVKLSNSGTLQWSKCYGGSLYEVEQMTTKLEVFNKLLTGDL